MNDAIIKESIKGSATGYETSESKKQDSQKINQSHQIAAPIQDKEEIVDPIIEHNEEIEGDKSSASIGKK